MSLSRRKRPPALIVSLSLQSAAMQLLRTLRHVVAQMLWWHRIFLLGSLMLLVAASIHLASNPGELQFLVLALVGLAGVRLCFVLRWRAVGKRWAGQRRRRTAEALSGEARFSGLVLLLLLLDPNSGLSTARLVADSKAETIRRLENAPDQSVLRAFLEGSGRVHSLVPTDRDLDESDWRTSGVDLVQHAETTVVSWGIIQSRNMLEQNLDLCVQAFIVVQERALADHLDG